MQSRVSDIDSHLTIPPTDWYQSLTAAGLLNPAVHGPARYWLQVEGSFTRALQKQCSRSFHVEVRREGFATPTQEEARRLRIPHRQHAWIREVSLCGDNLWNVSGVTDMASMFVQANNFNQALDSWDVSSVTSMVLQGLLLQPVLGLVGCPQRYRYGVHV